MSPLQNRIHEVIFEAETPAGKAFDVALLVLIALSVVVVALETVQGQPDALYRFYYYLEWGLTILFTLEYLLRIYSIKSSWKYISSFYGIVDLLSILPTYLSLFVAGSQYLLTIRTLRFLRVFRILKLGSYLTESQILITALQASRLKITVFLGAVMTVVVIIGSAMYLIEGNADSGFTSIPKSIYWAIVTITTVGYGDIAPVTAIGQLLSAVLMIMGYGVIAVPTGIVSVEIAQASKQAKNSGNTISCPNCSQEGHDPDASHCKYCGHLL